MARPQKYNQTTAKAMVKDRADGMTYSQIAKAYDINVNTVPKYINRYLTENGMKTSSYPKNTEAYKQILNHAKTNGNVIDPKVEHNICAELAKNADGTWDNESYTKMKKSARAKIANHHPEIVRASEHTPATGSAVEAEDLFNAMALSLIEFKKAAIDQMNQDIESMIAEWVESQGITNERAAKNLSDIVHNPLYMKRHAKNHSHSVERAAKIDEMRGIEAPTPVETPLIDSKATQTTKERLDMTETFVVYRELSGLSELIAERDRQKFAGKWTKPSFEIIPNKPVPVTEDGNIDFSALRGGKTKSKSKFGKPIRQEDKPKTEPVPFDSTSFNDPEYKQGVHQEKEAKRAQRQKDIEAFMQSGLYNENM